MHVRALGFRLGLRVKQAVQAVPTTEEIQGVYGQLPAMPQKRWYQSKATHYGNMSDYSRQRGQAIEANVRKYAPQVGMDADKALAAPSRMPASTPPPPAAPAPGSTRPYMQIPGAPKPPMPATPVVIGRGAPQSYIPVQRPKPAAGLAQTQGKLVKPTPPPVAMPAVPQKPPAAPGMAAAGALPSPSPAITPAPGVPAPVAASPATQPAAAAPAAAPAATVIEHNVAAPTASRVVTLPPAPAAAVPAPTPAPAALPAQGTPGTAPKAGPPSTSAQSVLFPPTPPAPSSDSSEREQAFLPEEDYTKTPSGAYKLGHRLAARGRLQ